MSVTVLGINGHSGHHVAAAFVAAGWTVKGFGRSNKYPIAGVEFVQGDADKVEDMQRAIGDSAVVVNCLNLPYDKWDEGRLEALVARTITASTGRTMLFPGNVYIYSAQDRVMAPDLEPTPETPRGEIRLRCEQLLKKAATAGDLKVMILRAGDFYGPESHSDWYDQVIMREACKGRIAVPQELNVQHAWAYLPDFGRAFVKVAEVRDSLAAFENFHFAGHFVRHGALAAAIQTAAPQPMKIVEFPWRFFGFIGLFSSVIRGVLKMRYLWENSMELVDPRLDAILGEDFDTPFDVAVAQTVGPFFSAAVKDAA